MKYNPRRLNVKINSKYCIAPSLVCTLPFSFCYLFIKSFMLITKTANIYFLPCPNFIAVVEIEERWLAIFILFQRLQLLTKSLQKSKHGCFPYLHYIFLFPNMKLQESKAVNMSGFIYIVLQLSWKAANLPNLLDYERILLKDKILGNGLKYINIFKQTHTHTKPNPWTICVHYGKWSNNLIIPFDNEVSPLANSWF